MWPHPRYCFVTPDVFLVGWVDLNSVCIRVSSAGRAADGDIETNALHANHSRRLNERLVMVLHRSRSLHSVFYLGSTLSQAFVTTPLSRDVHFCTVGMVKMFRLSIED